MIVTDLELANIKSFEKLNIELSPSINILVGKNNSGKSTILQSLLLIQNNEIPQTAKYHDGFSFLLRKNQVKGSITIDFSEPNSAFLAHEFFKESHRNNPQIFFEFETYKTILQIREKSTRTNYPSYENPQIIFYNEEPNNFIYPFLTKRKLSPIDEQISSNKANSVLTNLQNLNSKIARISQPDFPAYEEFRKICIEIFDFPISIFLTENGLKSGLIVDQHAFVPIDQMGEGTVNLLGLIVDLCIAKGKLFIIEELENDIHPIALKKVIELIILKSENNQFVISTHSNIVVKHLGSLEKSKTFYVESNLNENRIPTTSIKELVEPLDRIETLQNLGYDIFDFYLYSAYLLLEESSAEFLIKDYLIPVFIPELSEKIQTIACGGVSEIEPKFIDFFRLFLFVHTSSPVYQGKAWVIADGDAVGKKSIEGLKKKFKSWDESHFITFSKENFEEFLPEDIFGQEVKSILALKDKQKFEAKKIFWGKTGPVQKWLSEKPDDAKAILSQTAKEVIEILQSIATQLNNTHQPALTTGAQQ